MKERYLMRKRKVIICVGSHGTTAKAAKYLLNKERALCEREDSEEPILIMLKSPPNSIKPDLENCIKHPDSKVVVIGHSLATNADFLFDDDNTHQYVSDIAAVISFVTDKSTVAREKTPLKISLVSCFGGHRNNNTGDSLAENLHLELFHKKCHTNISARKSVVYIYQNGRKATMAMPLAKQYASLKEQAQRLSTNETKRAHITDRVSRFSAGIYRDTYEHDSKIVIKSKPNTSVFGYRKSVVTYDRQVLPDQIQHKINQASVLLKKSWLKCVRADDDGNTNQKLFNDISIAVQHARPESYTDIADVIEKQLSLSLSKSPLFDRITAPLFSKFYDEMHSVMKKLTALDASDGPLDSCRGFSK